MTKSQPGLYELLRQRSLKNQMSHHDIPEPEPISSYEAPTATLDRYPVEAKPEVEVTAVDAPEVERPLANEEPSEIEAAPDERWYQRSVSFSTPVGIAISILAAVLVFSSYLLGFSRGQAAEAPTLWANSGGTAREGAIPAGTAIAVRAAAFEDEQEAFQVARWLNQSGRFADTAEVVNVQDGGPVELVIGRFESQAAAKRSGLLEAIQSFELVDGESTQKPFGKAELRVYSFGN